MHNKNGKYQPKLPNPFNPPIDYYVKVSNCFDFQFEFQLLPSNPSSSLNWQHAASSCSLSYIHALIINFSAKLWLACHLIVTWKDLQNIVVPYYYTMIISIFSIRNINVTIPRALLLSLNTTCRIQLQISSNYSVRVGAAFRHKYQWRILISMVNMALLMNPLESVNIKCMDVVRHIATAVVIHYLISTVFFSFLLFPHTQIILLTIWLYV